MREVRKPPLSFILFSGHAEIIFNNNNNNYQLFITDQLSSFDDRGERKDVVGFSVSTFSI